MGGVAGLQTLSRPRRRPLEDVEILVLRHEVAVLRPHNRRPGADAARPRVAQLAEQATAHTAAPASAGVSPNLAALARRVAARRWTYPDDSCRISDGSRASHHCPTTPPLPGGPNTPADPTGAETITHGDERCPRAGRRR